MNEFLVRIIFGLINRDLEVLNVQRKRISENPARRSKKDFINIEEFKKYYLESSPQIHADIHFFLIGVTNIQKYFLKLKELLKDNKSFVDFSKDTISKLKPITNFATI